MKHEPKTMKAKADLMLKRGSISDAQHKKLHAKADVEIGKAKQAKAMPSEDDSAAAPEATADATQTPAKRKGATQKPVMRGQPLDQEERDQ